MMRVAELIQLARIERVSRNDRNRIATIIAVKSGLDGPSAERLSGARRVKLDPVEAPAIARRENHQEFKSPRG